MQDPQAMLMLTGAWRPIRYPSLGNTPAEITEAAAVSAGD